MVFNQLCNGRNGYVHPLIFLFKLNISLLIIIIGLDTCTWFNHINTYFRVFLFLIKWKSILITFGSMTQIETRHFWATLVHMFSKKTKAVVYWFLNSIICKYIRNTFNTNIYKLSFFLKKRCTGCCHSNDKKRVTFLNISINTRLNF